jgi:hypothetical protein
MYIRTECGLIQIYHFNRDTKLDKVGELVDGKFIEYKVKSQGDNLIDVLEDNDIIYDTSSLVKMFFKEYRSYYSRNDNKLMNEHLSYCDIRIITHEQYMKLAQEVK